MLTVRGTVLTKYATLVACSKPACVLPGCMSDGDGANMSEK